MVDIVDLVKKFKDKIDFARETESFHNNIAEPAVNKIFNDNFADIFKNITESLNEKLECNAVNFKFEGKNRFFIEGRYHRIIFQKGKTEIFNNTATATIIPICIWKGVSKHLKSITFKINFDSHNVSWSVDSPENYAKILFSKLIDDDDFLL